MDDHPNVLTANFLRILSKNCFCNVIPSEYCQFCPFTQKIVIYWFSKSLPVKLTPRPALD